MLIPLIDRSLYERLSAKRREMEQTGFRDLAPVFVPVGPELTDRVPVRLLFVGQATRGNLGRASDFDTATKDSIDIVSNYPRQSPFWQDIWKILEQVLRTLGAVDHLIQRRDEIVGWSNLAKIGTTRNEPFNPNEEEIKGQAELCIEALRTEARAFRPTATILFTGHYAEKDIMSPVFGPGDPFLDNVRELDRVAVKNHPEFGHVLWTYHPGSMRRDGYESEVVNFISGFVAGLSRRLL